MMVLLNSCTPTTPRNTDIPPRSENREIRHILTIYKLAEQTISKLIQNITKPHNPGESLTLAL